MLSSLAHLILALPHSSAEIERVFSQMSLVKSEKRNRLGEKNLETMLQMKEYQSFYETKGDKMLMDLLIKQEQIIQNNKSEKKRTILQNSLVLKI